MNRHYELTNRFLEARSATGATTANDEKEPASLTTDAGPPGRATAGYYLFTRGQGLSYRRFRFGPQMFSP